jgi:transposase InsO family protein
MIGPLPTAPGGFNRVLVAIDMFTKWIEVKPVTCPKADRVLDFLDELVHRYGLPHRIITDLGSNFNNHQFWECCENSGIDVRYVLVAHPRANGQVERANGMVLDGYLRIYCCKRLHALALLSRRRPPGPGDYSVTMDLAIQVYFFSNKV